MGSLGKRAHSFYPRLRRIHGNFWARGGSLFLVPFMLVWSGGSLGSIYGAQIASWRFSAGMSLFGLPFLIGTIFLGSMTLMAAAGCCRVTVRGDEAELFHGVGALGLRKRFPWSQVRRVREVESTSRNNGWRHFAEHARIPGRREERRKGGEHDA